MLAWLKRAFRRTPPLPTRIVADPFGFTLEEGNRILAEVTFSEVEEVAAFKRGLFAVDLICLAFRIPEAWVEVDEDMPGYPDLLRAIEGRFSVRQEDWFLKVAIPAFATNWTRLWKATSRSDT